jgi:bacillithiol biosynthesis deacetylase BshB1
MKSKRVFLFIPLQISCKNHLNMRQNKLSLPLSAFSASLCVQLLIRISCLFESSMTTITPDVLYKPDSAPSAPVHILAIAAHPDDVELSCGGVLAQATSAGKRVAIVECTRGEMGSRGTPELRRTEAIEAAQILGLVERWNLGIPDSNIADTSENALKIIAALRYFKPHILLFPAPFDRHLDHEDAHKLVRRAVFQSGMAKIETELFDEQQPTHRPKRLLSYIQTYEVEPHLYIDITGHFETKMRSIFAHSSQVHVPGQAANPNEPPTYISSPAFMNLVESRARHFGGRIGTEFAEAFVSIEPLGFKDMSALEW